MGRAQREYAAPAAGSQSLLHQALRRAVTLPEYVVQHREEIHWGKLARRRLEAAQKGLRSPY